MELLFDLKRIAHGLESRMSSALVERGVNELQMWLLLLVGGLLRPTMRGRRSLSANDSAVELCVKRTRVANEFKRLVRRELIVATESIDGADKRNRSFEVTDGGLDLARALRKLLQTLEKGILISSGRRVADREIEPQCLLLGLWISGSPDSHMPTLTRLANVLPDHTAGSKRGEGALRLKKAR